MSADLQTGARSYEGDFAERFEKPGETFRVTGFDPEQSAATVIRQGMFDIIATPEGPRYVRNELAARPPRKRGLGRRRGL